ncbi:MAG: YfiR family protein [Deltaproteobacteria bacterium]|nr:YfiR family protein [Deltaproteobacteria bacterium]
MALLSQRTASARGPVAVLCLATMLAAVVAGAVPPAPAQAPVASEYQVKAAFLYNFAKFVEWPAPASAEPDGKFVIGVLGDDPFGSDLDEVIRGKTVNGQPLELRRFQPAEDVRGCHIVFISASESGRLEGILASLRQSSVLTVADMPGFSERGGMVTLLRKGTRVGFEINTVPAIEAGLRISSKLLQLADTVRQ